MQDYFTIIIPSYNEEDHLPRLLQSLTRQTDNGFEVVVNDSLSTDRTKEHALAAIGNRSNFRFVEHKTKNVSAARNHGASLAKGNWLIFFDADVMVEDGFIEGIRNIVAAHKLDALTVWNRPKTKNFKGILALMTVNYGMSLFQKLFPAANGPCIIMRKELFEKLNGFDDTIVFGEDFNIIQRAHKIKARFAVFRHPLLYLSARRYEQEGLMLSAYKSMKALLYQLFVGPIRKPIFEYEMGGHVFKKEQPT